MTQNIKKQNKLIEFKKLYDLNYRNYKESQSNHKSRGYSLCRNYEIDRYFFNKNMLKQNLYKNQEVIMAYLGEKMAPH